MVRELTNAWLNCCHNDHLIMSVSTFREWDIACLVGNVFPVISDYAAYMLYTAERTA